MKPRPRLLYWGLVEGHTTDADLGSRAGGLGDADEKSGGGPPRRPGVGAPRRRGPRAGRRGLDGPK